MSGQLVGKTDKGGWIAERLAGAISVVPGVVHLLSYSNLACIAPSGTETRETKQLSGILTTERVNSAAGNCPKGQFTVSPRVRGCATDNSRDGDGAIVNGGRSVEIGKLLSSGGELP